jgi:hypothetical protein
MSGPLKLKPQRKIYMLDALKRLVRRLENREETKALSWADNRLVNDAGDWSLDTVRSFLGWHTALPARYAGMSKGQEMSDALFLEFEEVYHEASDLKHAVYSRLYRQTDWERMHS